MENTNRLWILLGAVMFITIFLLGRFGKELYRKVPPIPLQVQTTEGAFLLGKDDILKGQLVWQSIGGQQVGSIWGHGAYQAPDWSADWLHKEATALQEILSQKIYQQSFDTLDEIDRAVVKAHLKQEMRTKTYGGLALMIGLSLLPIGLAQTWVSIEHGLWYARSAAFLQLPLLETLRWLRMIGDTVFFVGVFTLAYFVAGLLTGWSYEKSASGQLVTPEQVS